MVVGICTLIQIWELGLMSIIIGIIWILVEVKAVHQYGITTIPIAMYYQLLPMKRLLQNLRILEPD